MLVDFREPIEESHGHDGHPVLNVFVVRLRGVDMLHGLHVCTRYLSVDALRGFVCLDFCSPRVLLLVGS
jgi:hypothetical protein